MVTCNKLDSYFSYALEFCSSFFFYYYFFAEEANISFIYFSEIVPVEKTFQKQWVYSYHEVITRIVLCSLQNTSHRLGTKLKSHCQLR